MRYLIKPSSVSGNIRVPPSKSHTLRALVFALMADGESKIRHYLGSPDTIAMIEAIKKFGAQVEMDEDVIYVQGVGGRLKRPDDVIDAGNSGLVFRLISAIAALGDSYVVVTGDESIRTRRPIKPLLNALTAQNIFAESMTPDGKGAVIIKGPIKAGCFSLGGQDSQPVSSLLIATSFLQGPSEIYVIEPGERPWIDLTLSWLSKFGIEIVNADYRYYGVSGGAKISPFDVEICGDFSTAAYLIAAAIVTKSVLTIEGLDMSDVQGDKIIIDHLIKMGVKIEYSLFEQSLRVDGRGEFSGMEIDINDCVDALPILAVIACFAKTATKIVGGRICRMKESDRIAAITNGLSRMGANIEEGIDGVVVYPSPLYGACLYSFKDHRIAMSLIVAALGATGNSEVDGVEYIAKTYPTFYCDFLTIGASIE